MRNPDQPKVPCTSLAVLSHFQRDAVQIDVGTPPTPDQWTDEDALRFDEKVLSAMSAASAPLLERHQAPTARLALLLRSMGRLGDRALQQRAVPLESKMGRWVAKLINEVGQTQPELLTRRGTWLLDNETPVPTLAALLHCRLYADVPGLSQESCSLLATGLTDDFIREQCYRLTMDGQATHLLWLTAVEAMLGASTVLDAMCKPDRLERLYELAAQDGVQGTHSRALLGRLARRAPAWRDTLTSDATSELRSRPFKVFARALVSHAVCGKDVTLNGIDDTLATLSTMVNVTPEDGVTRFGRAFNAALEQAALETAMWSTSSRRLVGRASGGLGAVDLVQGVFDILSRAGQLTPEFAVDFRRAYWAKLPNDFVASTVNARLIEVEMAHHIGSQPPAAHKTGRRRRASV